MVSMSMVVDPVDALAVQHLVHTYAAANDDRDVDAIVACFEPDGSFGLQVVGQEPVGPFDASTEPDLRTFMAETLGAQDDQRRHVVTNIRVVEASSDRWVVTSYFTLVVTDAGRTDVLTTGVYRDDVVRRPEGWRFAAKWLDLDGAP